MRHLALLILVLLCVGCAVTRERATEIATRELARRSLVLPRGHTLQVVEGDETVAGADRHKIWVAIFGTEHLRDRLYTVYIDQRTGRVSGVWGYRAGEPYQL